MRTNLPCRLWTQKYSPFTGLLFRQHVALNAKYKLSSQLSRGFIRYWIYELQQQLLRNKPALLVVVVSETSAIILLRGTTPNEDSPKMLDAFIIEKIQQDRDLQKDEREQLRINISRMPESEMGKRREEASRERGVAIIDFNI
jgi:hypothetical protein